MRIILESSVLGRPIGLETATKTKMLKGSDGEKSNESDDETGNKQQRTMTAASASSTNAQNRSRPLFVTKVTSNDVLMGRGAITDNHEGNKRFRDLVRQRKQEYNLTSRHQTKQEISNHIVATIKSRGGAFLRKIESTEESDKLGVPTGTFAWTHASDDVIHLKVKQALRDKNSMKDNDTQQQTTGTVATKTVGAGEEMKLLATKASPTTVPVSVNDRKSDKAIRSGVKKLRKENHPSMEQVTLLGESRLLPGNDRLSRMEQSLFLSASPPRPPAALASTTHPIDTTSSLGTSMPSGHLNIPYSSPSLSSDNTSSLLASFSQQRIREQQQLEESLLSSSSISSSGVGNSNDLYQSVAYQQLLRRLVLQQSELERASSFGSSNNNVLDYLRLLNDPAVAVQQQQQIIQMQQQRQAAAAAMANSVSQQRTFSGNSVAAANDDLLLEQQLANFVRLRNQFQPTQGSSASTAFVGAGTGAEQLANQNLMSHQSLSSSFGSLLASNNIRNTDLTLPNRRMLPAHNFGNLPTTSGLGNLNVMNQRSLIHQLDHQNPNHSGSQQSNLSDMMYRMDNSSNDRSNNSTNAGSQLDSQSISQSNQVNFVSPKKIASPFMAKKQRDELADKMNQFGTARKSATSTSTASPQLQSRKVPIKAAVKIGKRRRSSHSSSSSNNVDGSDSSTTISSTKRIREKKGQS